MNFTVFEDTSNPAITVIPTNITANVGYTALSFSWTATDTNPDTYTIELLGTGTVVSPTAWTSGNAIIYNIPDGFGPGVYTYIITFSDDYGNSVSGEVSLIITEVEEPPEPGIPLGISFLVFIGLSVIYLFISKRKKVKFESME